jgi:hypothetical protein
VSVRPYPSPITDPITDFFTDDLIVVAAVLFYCSALITALLADGSTSRGARFRAVSVLAFFFGLVIGVVSLALAYGVGAEPGVEMSTNRIVDILSAAGVYGLMIWACGVAAAKSLPG